MATVRSRKKNHSKLTIVIIILVILIVGVGAVGIYFLGGTIFGSIPGITTEEKIINPLTGQISKEPLPARPLVVSIDNVGDASPQSWLSKTDAVYEFPVEGKQTRLQAIYYGQFPEEFGPIRSTRPYFVDLAREYRGIFLAHGWSQEAREYLQSDVVPYINAMNTDCKFYRVKDKTAPHNSYIKWSEVKKKIDEKGWWAEEQEISPFQFLKGGQRNEGENASKINILYPDSKSGYSYNSQMGNYIRTREGQKYIDHETGEDITTYNIIVQKVESKAIDSYGRLEIDMCAGGEAMLFTNGVVVKGRWERANLDSRTIFVDEDGNELKLMPGNTWVVIADQSCTVTYE